MYSNSSRQTEGTAAARSKNTGRQLIYRTAPVFMLAALLFLALALAYKPARALTITVNSAAVFDGTNGLCSLTEAILNADSEGPNVQPHPDCGPGTADKFVLDTIILPDDTIYTLTETLPRIHSKILIEGNGSTIRRDPDDPNRFRLIHLPECYNLASGCNASGDLTLNDLTLSGGYDDVTTAAYGSIGGGAIASFGNKLTLNNCVLSGNTSVNNGGAINGNTEAIINGSTLSDNVALGNGGAVNAHLTLRVTGSNISDNNANGHGGGIAAIVNPQFLTDSIISDNTAGLDGGGVYAIPGIEADGLTISNNEARNGGGVFLLATNLSTFTDSTFSGNEATASGGGIWSESFLNIHRSLISDNTAVVDGGGIYHAATGVPLSLFNSTLSGNDAGRYGGGIQNTGHQMGMQNNTITLNTAARGGGIDLVNTLSGHRRNIYAGNVAPLGREMHVSGGSTSLGWWNVLGYGADSGLVGVSAGGSDIVPTGPLASILNPALATNGGPTMTHALVPGSPAIDQAFDTDCNAGSVLVGVDQRGLPRNVDGNGAASALECDSGAYELQGLPPTPTVTNTPEPTATNTPEPTATHTPEPTATNTPEPTATNTPEPTATDTPEPTATDTPVPTDTPTPTPTATPSPMVFSGFFSPVNNPPVVNSAKGGSAIPVKFSLGGDFGLSIFAPAYPGSQRIACDSGAPIDPIEETVTAGSSGLQYDPATGQYTYVWKTQKSWGGTCRQLILRFSDGQEWVALFSFK